MELLDLKLNAIQKSINVIPGLDGWCTIDKASRMIHHILDNDSKVILELGVYGGRSAIAMGFACQVKGNGRVFAVDPWDAIPASEADNAPAWWHSVDFEKLYRNFLQKVLENDLSKHVIPLRISSTEASRIFEPSSVDIIHQDGNHSEFVSCREVDTLWPILKENGLWFFDDIDIVSTKKAYEKLQELGAEVIYADDKWGVLRKPYQVVSVDSIQHIHKIVYINRDKRKDRRENIERQLARAGIDASKIIRFEAIEHDSPNAGCALSHATVLRIAKEENWPNVLILEDDFNFDNNLHFVNQQLKDFFDSDYVNYYDVLQLAHMIERKEEVNSTICRVMYGTNASAYLVHNRAYERMHSAILTGAEALASGKVEHWLYQNDRAWSTIQSQGQFYAFNKRLGYQRAGYSDLGAGFRDYGV